MKKEMFSFEEAYVNMISPTREFIEYNFWAHIVSQCEVQNKQDFDSPAGVYFNKNKFVLCINPKLFQNYSLRERLAILKHEMLHIILGHSFRKGTRDHKLFNISSDCAINQLINEKHLPKDCILPKTLSEQLGIHIPLKLTSEQYYDLLLPEIEKLEEEPDTHSLWEESEGESEVEKEMASSILNKAIEKSKGNLPSNISDLIKITSRKSKVSWKRVLNNLMASKKANIKLTTKKPNRRFPEREELLGKIKDYIFDVIVVLDVSGSMNNSEISLGLNEINALCKLQNSSLKIIQVDKEVQEIKKYKPSTTFTRKGAGGTRMYPAIEFIKENKLQYDSIIFITDGLIEDISTWEYKPNRPVIFLTTDKKIPGLTSSRFFKEFNLKEK